MRRCADTRPQRCRPALACAAFVAMFAVSLAGLGRPAQGQLVTEPEPEPRQGEVRIQGRTAGDTGPALDDGPAGILMDFRETMRSFVTDIADFARQRRPDFTVVVENSLELLIKRDDTDEELASPARTYMRSIDGIMVTNLFAGGGGINKPGENPERLKARLDLIDIARRNGLKVFVLDHADDRAVIDEGRAKARQLGAAYHASGASAFESATLPAYPARPFDESANSVISGDSINNFAVIGNSAVYGRQDEFALMMHQTNYDVIIVDVFHGREPLTKQAVETLKYKASGARRLVFARVDIGMAASYRYYWQQHWQEGSPPWLGAPLRGEPDHYFVEFWNPEWQRIIFGDPASYIYGVVDQGYDGVILGGVDSYEIFEGGEAAERRLQGQ